MRMRTAQSKILHDLVLTSFTATQPQVKEGTSSAYVFSRHFCIIFCNCYMPTEAWGGYKLILYRVLLDELMKYNRNYIYRNSMKVLSFGWGALTSIFYIDIQFDSHQN